MENDKFKDIYRIKSARAEWWDYSKAAKYFITICTQNRELFFGEIKNNKLNPTEVANIAKEILLLIPKQFAFAHLDEYTIMPNHIHMIIQIKYDNHSPMSRDAINRVSTHGYNHTYKEGVGGITNIHNPMLHKNISRIIRWYKGRVSYECRKIISHFAWQTRFHDHIIRNEQEYFKIKNYIQTNPEKWENDKFYFLP